ncbi:MAG TPA: VOC family protein [Thermoplasmata archaeon]|nr:VOC family protein [Thermoplasmata archaeon]
MTDVISGLHAVTLHIRDPEQARLFYRDVLGLKELMFDDRAKRLVFALPGTSTLLTMHVMGAGEGGREPGTVSGLVFRHPDPNAACREISRRGGTIVVEPTVVESAVGSFVRAVFADPDGNEFLLSNRTD